MSDPIAAAFPSRPTTVKLRVVGVPSPKGSKRARPNPKNPNAPFVVDNNPKGLKAWEGAVRREAERAMAQLGHPPVMLGPVRLRAVFYMPTPQSLSPVWRWLPTTKPDLDKLERATWDALTGIVFRDDAQIVDGARRKLYALDRTPGCVIEVSSLAELEEELGRAHRAGGPRPRLP